VRKILVLTNFTDVANHAATVAVPFCAQLYSNIILLNTFFSQPVLAGFGNSPCVIEEMLWENESHKKLTFLKEDLEELITTLPADHHHPSIDCRYEEGSLRYQLDFYKTKKDIEFIIMGARAGSTMEHLLIGSDTSVVLNRANRPVIIIPEGTDLGRFKKVTLACDFNESDLDAVHYLVQLGRIFHFQLEIVYVSLWEHNNEQNMERKGSFITQVARFGYPGIAYRTIVGKELINRLNRLCKENKTDLLVLVHDRFSLLNRIFKSTNANELLKQQQVPVMIIPSVMRD
jgi:nucleotide-binding universal stress UspA family protein